MIDKLFEHILESLKTAKEKYVDSNQVPLEWFTKFEQGDPSKTSKYVEWMCREYVKNPTRARHIIDTVKVFDEKANKKLIQKPDIYQYSFEEVDKMLQDLANVKTNTQIKKDVKSTEAIKLFEDDDVLVVQPLTHKASCLYGSNTKWCTTMETSDHWDNYWTNGINLYYIIDKVNNKKYAVAVYPNGQKECFDEKDNYIKYETIKQELGI